MWLKFLFLSYLSNPTEVNIRRKINKKRGSLSVQSFLGITNKASMNLILFCVFYA